MPMAPDRPLMAETAAAVFPENASVPWSAGRRLTTVAARQAFKAQFIANDLAYLAQGPTVETPYVAVPAVYADVPKSLLWFHGGTVKADEMGAFSHLSRHRDGSYSGPGIYFTQSPLEAMNYADINGGRILAACPKPEFRLLKVPSRLNHFPDFAGELRAVADLDIPHYHALRLKLETATGVPLQNHRRAGTLHDSVLNYTDTIKLGLPHLVWAQVFNRDLSAYFDYLRGMADGMMVLSPKRVPNLIVFNPEAIDTTEVSTDRSLFAQTRQSCRRILSEQRAAMAEAQRS